MGVGGGVGLESGKKSLNGCDWAGKREEEEELASELKTLTARERPQCSVGEIYTVLMLP